MWGGGSHTPKGDGLRARRSGSSAFDSSDIRERDRPFFFELGVFVFLYAVETSSHPASGV